MFEAIKQSPQFVQNQLQAARAALPNAGFLVGAVPVVVGIFVLVALNIGTSSRGMNSPYLFSIIPFGMAAFGIAAVAASLVQGARSKKAKPLGCPCIVIGKRTDVSGGGNGSTRTKHHVTVELENGFRQEFDCTADLYGRLAEDDAGILYSKGDIALDFDRVAV